MNAEQVANVCDRIGLSVSSDTQGYQAQYGSKGITLSVWCKPGVSLERLVTEEQRLFTDQLIITTSVLRRERKGKANKLSSAMIGSRRL